MELYYLIRRVLAMLLVPFLTGWRLKQVKEALQQSRALCGWLRTLEKAWRCGGGQSMTRDQKTYRLAYWIASFIIAVVLLSGWYKILYPADFALAVYRFHLLPDFLVNAAALYFQWLEMVCAFCLLFIPRYRVAALWITLALPQFFDHGRRDYKIPFKNFGQQLAAKSLPESGVRILSTTKAAFYTYLYANLSQTHVRPLGEQYRLIGSCDIDENLLRKGGFDYLIVLDNDGSRTRLTQVLASAQVPQLRLAEEMTIPKYGRVYFYERP